MTKITPQAKAALAALHELHLSEQEARARIRLEVEALFASRLADLRAQKSRAANRALALGAPKRQIGLACGTTASGTIRDLLALTAGEFQQDPNLSQFTLGPVEGGTLPVTVNWVVWGGIRHDLFFSTVAHWDDDGWCVYGWLESDWYAGQFHLSDAARWEFEEQVNRDLSAVAPSPVVL